MKNLIAAAALALALLVPIAGHAQGIPIIQGTPMYTVPDYNMTITIQAINVAGGFGDAVYMLEKHSDGQWYGFWNSDFQVPGDLPNIIAAAGGPVTWLNLNIVAKARAALATRFPPIGSPPPATGDAAVDLINTTLFQSFAFSQNADGTISIGIKQ